MPISPTTVRLSVVYYNLQRVVEYDLYQCDHLMNHTIRVSLTGSELRL